MAHAMRAAPALLPVLALLPLLSLLGACDDGAARVASTPPPPRYAAPLHRTVPPPAHVQQAPGTEAVIGAEAATLARLFGPARLDVWEGDARKLQFWGAACVLDVFLYPPAPGQPPQASYVEARRATDAREVDRATCITALRKR